MMKEALEHFREKGWFLHTFQSMDVAFEAREKLQKRLEALLGKSCPLEEYHLEAFDDSFHTTLQIEMTAFFRKERFGPRFFAGEKDFFQTLLGPDLKVQANPYLRMTRPFKPQDNIGYHRDTFYGGSPYELSVLVPFVTLPKECSLRLLSGSHIHSEENYPTTQFQSTEVSKGSHKHKLGFLYAPKVMNPTIEKEMEAIPIRFGQALIFSLATVHGSVENRGEITRWSSDMRIMNALAPVDLSARPDYYEWLSSSVVTEAARTYFEANELMNV